MRHDLDNELLSEAIHMVFIELSKLEDLLKKPVEQMTDLELWSIFLRYAELPDYRDIVNRIIESKEALSVASELLMSISQDERERAIFRSRRMYQSDLESNMLTARREGKREKAHEIAKNLLSMGMPIDEIVVVTGLTHEEFDELCDAD